MLVLGYAAPKPASCCCCRNITIALMLLVTGCRNQTEGIVVGRVTVSGQNLNRGVATLHVSAHHVHPLRNAVHAPAAVLSPAWQRVGGRV